MYLEEINLVAELQESLKRLDQLVSESGPLGEELAKAERDYKKAKRLGILYERAKGTAVTITSDIVRGREDISNLAFARDCAKTKWESNREAIMAEKIKINVMKDLVANEYRRMNNGA